MSLLFINYLVFSITNNETLIVKIWLPGKKHGAFRSKQMIAMVAQWATSKSKSGNSDLFFLRGILYRCQANKPVCRGDICDRAQAFRAGLFQDG